MLVAQQKVKKANLWPMGLKLGADTIRGLIDSGIRTHPLGYTGRCTPCHGSDLCRLLNRGTPETEPPQVSGVDLRNERVEHEKLRVVRMVVVIRHHDSKFVEEGDLIVTPGTSSSIHAGTVEHLRR